MVRTYQVQAALPPARTFSFLVNGRRRTPTLMRRSRGGLGAIHFGSTGSVALLLYLGGGGRYGCGFSEMGRAGKRQRERAGRQWGRPRQNTRAPYLKWTGDRRAIIPRMSPRYVYPTYGRAVGITVLSVCVPILVYQDRWCTTHQIQKRVPKREYSTEWMLRK